MIESLLNGCLTASRQRKNRLKIDAAQQLHDRPVILAAIRRAVLMPDYVRLYKQQSRRPMSENWRP